MGCIYMYTNKINGKQYVGQTSRDLKTRHWQHLSQHDTYIDRAIQKYGKDNFILEVLEDNIFDIDELNRKEQFYIEKYDTFNNGYNLNRGGDNHTKFNYEDRDLIAKMIKESNMPFSKIGELTGYSVYTVSDINQGKTLPKEGEKYPLREKRWCDIFTEQDALNVVNLLKNTELTYSEIAEQTGTNFYFVNDINRGKRKDFILKNESFPLRNSKVKRTEMTMELACKIIKMLKERDDLSSNEIGEILNIPGYTVGQINRGKASICKEIKENFPIRKKQHKASKILVTRKISIIQLQEIIDLLLNTDLNLEEIAQRFNVNRGTISRINRGVKFNTEDKKYYDYKFPIRQNKIINLKIFNSVNEQSNPLNKYRETEGT